MGIVAATPDSGELSPDEIVIVGSDDAALATCRCEFEGLLRFAQGDAQRLEAHEAEEGLYRRLLSLGLRLLALYFARKGLGPTEQALASQGKIWPRNGVRWRIYRSVFGAIKIARAYFHREGEGGFCPLDAQLNLRADGYSRLLCKWSSFWSVRQAYAKVSDWLQMLLGVRLWTRPLEKLTQTAAVDAEAFLAQAPPPEVSAQAELLVVSADGKGVPMRRPAGTAPRGKRRKKGEKANKKKMAVVTSIYQIERQVRSADDFMRGAWSWLSGRGDDAPAKDAPQPEGKRVGATLKGKAHAMALAAADVCRRDPNGRFELVLLCDGEKSFQEWLAKTFGRARVLILDLIHVIEKLWAVATGLHGEGAKEAEDWVGLRVKALLLGNVGRVIGGLKQMLTKSARTGARKLSASARMAIQKAITYFTNNRDRMRYNEYLAAGYPIATGVVEGACRHLVKDRMELAGMRWTEEGAEAVLALRAIQINGQWEDFWRFRFTQDRARLYAAHANAVGVPLRPPGAASAA
jgi:hypothetical protein